MYLEGVWVRPVHRSEKPPYQELTQAHHDLGTLPKIAVKPVVRRQLPRRMGGLAELFCCRLEVRGTGSLDRMEFSPSV